MKIFKTALVLTLVGIACGILIGFSNQITAPIIAKNKLEAELKAYKEIFPTIDDQEVLEYTSDIVSKVIVAKEGGNVIGYLVMGKQANGFGYIDMIVGFDKDGTIVGIEIVDFNQTPSYQAGILSRALQFEGTALADIPAKGPQIDASAGATSQGFNTVKLIVAAAVDAYNEAVK